MSHDRYSSFIHESLLKEYEMCQHEATSTANWIWASTTVFHVIWLSGLGAMVLNVSKIDIKMLLLVSVVAIAYQLVWISFLRRSLIVRQRLFVRQRQIERRLEILKSHAMTVADEPANFETIASGLPPERRVELSEFLELTLPKSQPFFERRFIGSLVFVIEHMGFGRAGRSALYLGSIIIAGGWLALPIIKIVC